MGIKIKPNGKKIKHTGRKTRHLSELADIINYQLTTVISVEQ